MSVTKSNRGMALLGAMAAVTVSSIVGVSMLAYYQTFLKQSRQAYVRAIMTSVDNRIRMMAMQPYAYVCGAEAGADRNAGISSCKINAAYFADMLTYEIPGACPPSAPCGLRLIFRQSTQPGLFPIDFDTVNNPTTGVNEQTGLFPYTLTYEGVDFQLAPMGYDLLVNPTGMPVPREILQSNVFDCAASDPKNPVFSGFDVTSGKPICKGFKDCDPKKYVTALNFKTLTLSCDTITTSDKMIDCRSGDQQKISQLTFNNGKLAGQCSTLPIPVLDTPVVTPPVNGACGPAAGGPSCASGTLINLTAVSPRTWTCQGANGGSNASCFETVVTPPPSACTGPNLGGGRFFITAGSSWTVPCDWNPNNNTIEAIGGGAGGGTVEAGAGGGGGYSKSTNVALTKGALLAMNVGAAGRGANFTDLYDPQDGGDSFLGGANCASAVICAKGGQGAYPPWNSDTAHGGRASEGVGQVKYSGGQGNGDGTSGTGGGGAAGPHGNGAMGGGSAGHGGGGGGGASGGSIGSDNVGHAGGKGGNNWAGGGGGAAGIVASKAAKNGVAGTNGGGGGGAAGGGTGAKGGDGTDWDATHGAGGGGGGNGNNGGNGGAGGLYGGGGGGCEDEGLGGNGAPGIIVINYTP